jgi:hypothetical protein
MSTLRLPHFHRGGPHPLLDAVRALAWPIAGAAVLAYIVVAAAGGIEPSEAEVVTVAACVLAVVWSAHAWRRLWADEHRE